MKKQVGIFLMLFALLFAEVANAQRSGRDKKWSDEEIDAFIEKSELIPIMINGDKDNRINIVLMNRWTAGESEPYNSPEMRDEFIKDIQESMIAALTPGDPRAQTAYANFREFFNVYGLWFPDSPEWNKGINGNAVDAMRDKLFLPWADENLGWVTFLVMPNSNAGGGGAGRNLEQRVGRALIAGNGIAKMLHEIAHTCMSIGDEYTGPATGTSANPTYTISTEYERDLIKWRKWIDPETPLPTPYTKEYVDKVGAFEGGQYHLTGYYRSTAQGCIMGSGVFDNTERMCPICEQRVSMRVYKLVNPIEHFAPKNTDITISGKTKLHFEIDHIKPEPNTQVVRWILNGKTIATGVDEVDVEFGALEDYQLICSLTDENPLILPDPPYAKYPVREIEWSVTNTVPTSSAKDLQVELQPKVRKNEVTLRAKIAGGKAPYTYAWSDGSTTETLENVAAGIYEVQVTDSEFRSATAKYTVLQSVIDANSSAKNEASVAENSFTVEANVTASYIGKNNGKINVTADGGTAPYRMVWKDGKTTYSRGIIYEAEDASIAIPKHSVKEYFDASNKKMIEFNDGEGAIAWTVEVAKSGVYPIDIVYAGVARKGTPMSVVVNGKTINNAVMFEPTRPLYTGWETATVEAFLNEGENIVHLKSTGKSGANIDYLRVPASYTLVPAEGDKRFNLEAGEYTVQVSDAENNMSETTVTVPEVYPFEIPELEVKNSRDGVVSIANPLPGYTYLWYAEDVPLFTAEKFEEPIFVGTDFTPEKSGSYYIAAKNNKSNVESTNRICVAVDRKPQSAVREMSPSQVGEDHIVLWFDASDLDGDGNVDGAIPDRGPKTDWMEKTWKNPGKIFTKYEPKKLNGLGVGNFGSVWVSDLGKKVSGIQTVILVYRESSLTFPGKWIFRDLNKYLGASKDPSKSIFDYDFVDEKTKKAEVFLNGQKIDPFSTPNPMDFCMLTIQFNEQITDPFERIEGYWEGDIAEMIFIDKALTDTERKGIEEHLRKKWFSTVDIEF